MRVSRRHRASAVAASALMLAALPLPGTAQLAAGAGRRSPSAPPAAPRLRYRLIGCRAAGPALAHRSGPRRRRDVALTFDDGPAALTGRFVGMLEARHAVATFFLIGDQITPAYGRLLRRELRAGDVLGDHTWSHRNLTGYRDVKGQLRRGIEAIRAASGYTTCVFRPPYGAYDARVLHVARALGLATITWNVDPRDWTLPGSGAIAARVLAAVQPGSIVLSHDGGGPRGQTLAAYPRIITTLRARGYHLVTVPQLLGFRPIYVRCRLRCGGAAVRRPPPGAIVMRG